MITLIYFAIFRHLRGLGEETVPWLDGCTPRTLYESMQERYRFPPISDGIKIAVNEDFADWDTSLQPGMTVVFLAPAAGG